MNTKIKRWDYSPKKYGLASQNEPARDCLIECNVRLYPDMLQAYKKFAELFHLGMDQFILCNGGENAMKQALLAIKPKDLTWFVPTWKMPEVFCAALDIEPIMKEFKYDPEARQIYTPDLEKGGDCFYSNYSNSSLFHYEGRTEHSLFGWNKNFKTTIIDLTYLNFKEMQMVMQADHILENENAILIGSFDKLIGGGLRLGFVVFNKKWNDKMQLQREQYINMCAYNWLLRTLPMDLKNWNSNPLQQRLYDECFPNLPPDWSFNNNRITVPYHVEANLNEVHFEIDGKQFTKFGIPQESDKESLDKLFWILKDLMFEKEIPHDSE